MEQKVNYHTVFIRQRDLPPVYTITRSPSTVVLGSNTFASEASSKADRLYTPTPRASPAAKAAPNEVVSELLGRPASRRLDMECSFCIVQ